MLNSLVNQIQKWEIFVFAEPKTANVSISVWCGRNFWHPPFLSTIGPKEQLEIKKLYLTSMCTREGKLVCTISFALMLHV